MRRALFPALKASTTKFCGQASTISSVCVPILPVEPKIEIRFWKVDPLSDSESVFWSEAAVFTGAEGSIHPAPVPADPGGEKTLSEELLLLILEVRVRLLPDDGEKEETLYDKQLDRTTTAAAAAESFMVDIATDVIVIVLVSV
jgi:hypothetical protein